MKKLFPILLAWSVLSSGIAIATSDRDTPKTPAKSGEPGKTSSKTKSGTRHGARSAFKHSPRRSSQRAPTPERYREIQQALAGKGYFTGEASGKWDSDSMDALKRFQHEQNIAETGKLDSVSLIALGLGPKRSSAPHANPQPVQKRPQDDNRRPEGSERP